MAMPTIICDLARNSKVTISRTLPRSLRVLSDRHPMWVDPKIRMSPSHLWCLHARFPRSIFQHSYLLTNAAPPTRPSRSDYRCEMMPPTSFSAHRGGSLSVTATAHTKYGEPKSLQESPLQHMSGKLQRPHYRHVDAQSATFPRPGIGSVAQMFLERNKQS
jgi:hypothetical protein